MFQKFLASFVSLGMLLQTTSVAFATPLLTTKQIYNYASKQDIAALKNIKKQLEILDNNGNTAVCQSILNGDVKTYNTLVHAGANANAPCVKNIPQTTYNDFMTSVAQAGMSGGDAAATGTVAGTTATATSTGTFLGMGAVGWGITGAVVAGGVAAAAGGGGGGGGGSGAAPAPNPCSGITCGTNAFCSAGSCVCNSGYEGDAETACTLIPLNCHNGNQTGTKCTCDEGWTGTDCTQPVNCGYTTTSCGNGYTATGNTCQSGNNTYIECTPNDCSNYQPTCGDGYDATQSCLSGTTPYYTCTPKDVPSGYTTTPCTGGYEQDGATFVSGTTNYYKCKAVDCSAQGYQPTCGDGYDATQSCLSGTTPYYTCTPKDVPSGYTTTPCTGGYEQDGATFVSGTTNYYKCKEKDVPAGYQSTECGEGYNTTDTFLSGESTYYKCEAKTVPDGYQIIPCGTGYKQTGTFLSGTTTYYQCAPADVPDGYTTTPCTGDYEQDGETFVSGMTNYYKCKEKDIPPGYQLTECGEGYDIIDTFSSVGTTYYKCQIKSCPGYTVGSCPENAADCNTCYRGETETYKVNSCKTGWEGDKCETHSIGYTVNEQGKLICDVANGYGKNGQGICVLKSDTVTGSDIDYYGYADIIGKTKITTVVKSDDFYKFHYSTDIKNHGDSNIIGRESSLTAPSLGELNSSNERVETENLSTLNINNVGDGNIYGIKGPIDQKRAIIHINDNSRYGVGLTNPATGIIHIDNSGDGNVIGVSAGYVYNILNENKNYHGKVSGLIDIKNIGHNSEAFVIGMEGLALTQRTDPVAENADTILITNFGDATVYGIKSSHSVNLGTIDITNIGNYPVYGISSENFPGDGQSYKMLSYNEGVIQINNLGLGTTIGLSANTQYSHDSVRNLGTIKIKHANYELDNNTVETVIADRINEVYGIKAVSSSSRAMEAGNSGIIEISDSNIAYGVYAQNTSNAGNISLSNVKEGYGLFSTQNGRLGMGLYDTTKISIVNAENGYGLYGTTGITVSFSRGNIELNNVKNAYGIYTGSNSTIEMVQSSLASVCDIHITDADIAYGIYSDKNSSIKNTGTITISGSETGYGIYAKGNGGTISNSGTIDISATNAYGIFVENGTGTTVTNTGTIKLNGVTCTGDCSGNTDNGNYIVLNGADLINAGLMSAQSLNTANLGGNVVATANSKWDITNDFSGPLGVSADLTTRGFNTTYVAENMINAGDTSELQLKSQSALFDASLAGNGSDVVMKMKSFDTVTDNRSFAKFLATNYALGQNEAFFNTLKQIGSMSELTGSLDKMMGKEMLSRFAFEDMTMMRELNFDMNNHLFNNKESYFSIGGSVSSPMAFKGDNGSNSRYSLSSKSDGVWSIGLGVAFTDIRSDDDHDNNSRSDTMYQMIVPIGYKTAGFQFMTSPRLGYARGSYDRVGFNDKSYDGTIEKRIFGLMNEARYPITVGDWKFEPAVEFNALGYEQKGWEDKKEFSLNIPIQRTYSVESGIGLYATHEKELNKDSKFKLTAGVAAYHEFADPYKMDVGMNGLSGHFTLRDENRTDNRAVARTGFEFNKGDYSLTGSFISYIDRETRTKANLGFKWKF